MSIVFSTPDMHHGGSLYGSQGDQEGSRTYVRILKKIAENGAEKSGIHCKIAVIRDVIAMLKQYCGIEHLGVMSLDEMFTRYFKQHSTGHLVDAPKIPDLKTNLPYSLRMTPLYAPAGQNCLTWWMPDKEKLDRYLFIDTNGHVVLVDARHKIVGHLIEYPHEVTIQHAEDGMLAECFNLNPLVFDYCMRNLVALGQAAAGRAVTRMEAARKSVDAITVITEEMRAGDLTVAILLSEEEPRGMTGSRVNQEIFGRLVEKAGSTPAARREALEAQVKLLKRKSLLDISHLSQIETDTIIDTWKIG